MDIKINETTVIVFDLDDTLYNELDFLKSAYQYIAQQLEPEDWRPLFVFMFSLYRSNENVFNVIANKYNLDSATLIKMYRSHTPNITVFKGVRNRLEEIKRKKGKIGIITDGRSKTQRAKINALGISDLVDNIVISEEIGSEKPSLANFKIMEDNLSGDIYYYMADNLKKDFITPNTIGWKTIGLMDNGLNIHYHSHLYIDKEHLPEQFVSSFLEIQII